LEGAYVGVFNFGTSYLGAKIKPWPKFPDLRGTRIRLQVWSLLSTKPDCEMKEWVSVRCVTPNELHHGKNKLHFMRYWWLHCTSFLRQPFMGRHVVSLNTLSRFQAKGNVKRGISPRLKIWPGDFDLWPWKSIGFHIIIRTKYVPSLVKIHWRMLILRVFTRMLRKYGRWRFYIPSQLRWRGDNKSLLLLLNAVCFVEKQQIPIL
jgi:hypothetical protein